MARTNTTKKEENTKKQVKNTLVCTCCGEEKPEKDFYGSESYLFKYKKRMCVCKECLIEAYIYYKNEKYENQEQIGIYKICELLDIYYDASLIASSHKELQKTKKEETDEAILRKYMKNVQMPQYKGMTFEDKTCDFTDPKEMLEKYKTQINSLTEEQENAKKEVTRLLGYDPYIDYGIPDQRYLYIETLPYLDEDTLDDSYKIGVIIQIVINNNQIRKANIAINALSDNIQSMTDNSKLIGNLADMTTKWNQQNDKLSKENQIALKHRTGSGSKNSTLGSMMKHLRELGFEKAEHNYYDMKKSYGMKVSADISNKSIADIINFDDNDINTIIKTQRESIQTLQDNELDLKEQIRTLANEKMKLTQELDMLKNTFDKTHDTV